MFVCLSLQIHTCKVQLHLFMDAHCSNSSYLRYFKYPVVIVSLSPAFSVFLWLVSAGVVDNLQTGGFFNDKVTKSCLFSTVHDAVLYCQSTRTGSLDKVMSEPPKSTLVQNSATSLVTIFVRSHLFTCFCFLNHGD